MSMNQLRLRGIYAKKKKKKERNRNRSSAFVCFLIPNSFYDIFNFMKLFHFHSLQCDVNNHWNVFCEQWIPWAWVYCYPSFAMNFFFLHKKVKYVIIKLNFPVRLLLHCIKIAPANTVYYKINIVMFFIRHYIPNKPFSIVSGKIIQYFDPNSGIAVRKLQYYIGLKITVWSLN